MQNMSTALSHPHDISVKKVLERRHGEGRYLRARLWARHTGIPCQLCRSPALTLARVSTSLSLSLHICKMGAIISKAQGGIHIGEPSFLSQLYSFTAKPKTVQATYPVSHSREGQVQTYI